MIQERWNIISLYNLVLFAEPNKFKHVDILNIISFVFNDCYYLTYRLIIKPNNIIKHHPKVDYFFRAAHPEVLIRWEKRWGKMLLVVLKRNQNMQDCYWMWLLQSTDTEGSFFKR